MKEPSKATLLSRKEVLDEIKHNGGFTIFWLTDKRDRARAAQRLTNLGIIRKLESKHPWLAYEIVKP